MRSQYFVKLRWYCLVSQFDDVFVLHDNVQERHAVHALAGIVDKLEEMSNNNGQQAVCA